jgi:hypothetical protein
MQILPISKLHLFQRHTRATWALEYGEQAPPWDRTYQIKRWADPKAMDDRAPDDVITYRYLNEVNGTPQEFTVRAWEAARVNLPGVYVYPKYVVPPTPATVAALDGSGVSAPINPAQLSYEDDALELAEQVSQDLLKHSLVGPVQVLVQESVFGGRFAYNWNGELRRFWNLRLTSPQDIGVDNVQVHNVGLLLAQRHERGYKAPGNWTMDGERNLTWRSSAASQETGERDTRPEVPVPIRSLGSNETLQRTIAGWVLVQNALQTDRQILEDIQTRVVDIQRRIS